MGVRVQGYKGIRVSLSILPEGDPDASENSAPLVASNALFSLRLARSNPLKKKTMSFARLFAFGRANRAAQARFGVAGLASGRPRRRFWGVPSLDFRVVFRSFFRSNLPSIFRCIFDVVCSSCRVDRGSAKRRRTLILCALSRFFKVFSTSRILADTMKVSSSDRRSSKSRSKKSIEFSSKNRSEIVEISGLRPSFAKNASQSAMGVLPDVPGAPPSEPAAPQERPGRALGAPQNVPRASGSAPEASPECPGSAPNRPKSPPRGPRAIFHRFFIDLGSIFDGFWR